MDVHNLSSIQLDVLREIGNIGAGNAATSMATLIEKRIDMEVPSVDIVSFDEMVEIVGGPEQLIVSMFFNIIGEAPGTVYLILTLDEAETLVQQILNDGEIQLFNQNKFDELAISALKEVGNILTGSYLSALADFIKLGMQPSIPYLSVDMAGAVLTAGLTELLHISDYAIVINTEIGETNNGLNGHFFYLPNPETLPKIFSTLGIIGHD